MQLLQPRRGCSLSLSLSTLLAWLGARHQEGRRVACGLDWLRYLGTRDRRQRGSAVRRGAVLPSPSPPLVSFIIIIIIITLGVLSLSLSLSSHTRPDHCIITRDWHSCVIHYDPLNPRQSHRVASTAARFSLRLRLRLPLPLSLPLPGPWRPRRWLRRHASPCPSGRAISSTTASGRGRPPWRPGIPA